MTEASHVEIKDLPAFFEQLEEGVLIHPILSCEKGIRGGYRLILEGLKTPLTVYEGGRPAWFSGVADILPVLRCGYVMERLVDEARVDLRGGF